MAQVESLSSELEELKRKLAEKSQQMAQRDAKFKSLEESVRTEKV